MAAFQCGQVALGSNPTQVQLPTGNYQLLLRVGGTAGDYAYVGNSPAVSSSTGFPLAEGYTVAMDVSISSSATVMWAVGTAGDTLFWMVGK